VRRRAFIQFVAAHGVDFTVVRDEAEGCASFQLGKVLVEKRWCTRPSAETQSGLRRSS
jgi:hypothetical protein